MNGRQPLFAIDASLVSEPSSYVFAFVDSKYHGQNVGISKDGIDNTSIRHLKVQTLDKNFKENFQPCISTSLIFWHCGFALLLQDTSKKSGYFIPYNA